MSSVREFGEKLWRQCIS